MGLFLTLTLLTHIAISNDLISVSPLISDGRALGFEVKGKGFDVRLLLGSQGNIWAERVREIDGVRLRLEGLKADPTPTLGEGSFVEVELKPGDPYPEVRFKLQMESFDEKAWREAIGEAPFHFLVCPLPGAEIFHQRGWNIPTPVIDPYPLQGDQRGYGKQIASDWSRNWTYCPPIGAYPLATVGLWKPSSKLYVAYDFHGARLTDHTEKYIASAYCWRLGEAEQFFTLVYPYAEGYVKLRYPEPPVVISSHFTLLVNPDLGPDSDPNLFVQEFIWDRYRDLLPSAPEVSDLSWLPGPYRVKGYGPPRMGRLYHRLTERNARWFKPGTLIFGGIGWDLSPVDHIFEVGDERAIERLAGDLEFLAGWAERMVVDGEECIYWRKPLEGEGIDIFGKGVETLHNIQGWQLALAYLDAYRNDPDRFGRYLPLIDGVLRWTKHILYTRNGYADVPTAQFCWGAAPSVAFCLRYYYTFRDDPERRRLAQEAYRLARTMMYRYMPIWACDNDEMDNLDSSFLMEPNSGVNWLGSACSNEVWCVVYAMILTYVSTGDPVIGHYLRGACERWHELFRDEYHPTVEKYDGAFTEMLGLFEGCKVGKGKRADFGGLWGMAERIAYPVGDAVVRVVCGEKAALAFCKGGRHTNIDEYRYYGDGSFSFKLIRHGKGRPQPFDLNVTFPMFDLRGKKVFLMRGSSPPRELKLGVNYEEMPNRPDTLVIHGVRYGDTIGVGMIDLSVEPLPCRIAKPRGAGPDVRIPEGFKIYDLRPFANVELSYDWDDPNSWAGLEPGVKTIFGVPFHLIDPDHNGGRVCLKDRAAKLRIKGRHLFALVSEVEEGGKLILRGDPGEVRIDLSGGVPALRGWPPCMKWRIDLIDVPIKGEFDAVEVRGGLLFALTTFDGEEKRLDRILAALEGEKEKVAAERKAIEKLLELKPLFERFSGRIAVMPFPKWNPFSNPLIKLIHRAELVEHLVFLTPEQLVDPLCFSPDRYPFLLYLGGERYYRTVNAEGDVERVLKGFLKRGGTLLVFPTGPFPFYYDQDGKHIPGASSRIGLPVSHGWERPPEGVKLAFKLNPDQKIVTSIPSSFPFPEEGDLRWRPLVAERSEGYIPILTLTDGEGKSYGDGAGIVRIGEGRIVYVWHTLLRMPGIGDGLIRDLLRYALESYRPPLPLILCPYTSEPIGIDGVLDEGAWREVEPVPLRYACINRSGEPPEPTFVKVRWDSENLYVAYVVHDSNPWATMRERDMRLWEEEVVELFVDPDGDGRGYREFEVNPIGTVVDLDISPEKSLEERLAWDASGWRCAVRRTDFGWIVEMAIPLSNFPSAPNIPPGIGDEWRINFYRIDRPSGVPRDDENAIFSAWSFVERSYHEPNRFGFLRFIPNIYDEDFSLHREGAPPGEPWIVQAGEWRVEGGTLLGRNGGTDGWVPKGIYLPLDLSDYRVEVRFRVESRGSDWRDGPWFGVRCRGGDGYFVEFTDRTVQLHKSIGGICTDDRTRLAEVEARLEEGWHLVGIEVRGRVIRVSLDGAEIIRFEDEGEAPERGGLIISPRRWSRSSGETVIRCSRVKIEPIPGG